MIARWAAIGAYVNALATLASILTSDPSTALLNNIAGVVWAVSFFPVAVAFYLAARSQATIASAAVFGVGIVAMAASVSLEIAAAVGRVSLDQYTAAYLPVYGALGVWLVLGEALVLLETAFSRGPLIVGIAVGASWFAANLLFGAGGVPAPDQAATNDAADMGRLLLVVGEAALPLWGFWLARSFRRMSTLAPR